MKGAVILIVAGAVGGCGNSVEKLDDAEKAATSWSATLQLMVDQWAGRRVPTLYVRQLCKAADKALAKQGGELADVPAGDVRRPKLQARIECLRQEVGAIRSAAERGDFTSGAQSLHLNARDQGGSRADGGR